MQEQIPGEGHRPGVQCQVSHKHSQVLWALQSVHDQEPQTQAS